jgi:hypothetical protein
LANGTSSQVPVDICNGALILLGANKIITSITGGDTSTEATQCAQVYYDIVDECLGDNDWSFARKRVLLSQLNVSLPYIPDNSQLSIVYSYPPDYIKAWRKSSRWARMKLLGAYIISDTVNLGIEYTYKNYIVSSYYSKFKMALQVRLASQLAFSISNSVKKAAELRKQYEEIELPAACSEDGQQGDPGDPIQDEWENSRLMGDVTLAGVSGQDVWFPIS